MTVMAERPTTHGTELGDFEEMLALLDELELRDGFKAEIIRGTSSCRRGRRVTTTA